MNSTTASHPILIIDDDPNVLLFLRLCLAGRGYPVHVAENGEEGIKKIETHDYRVIITDIKMKPVSGDQLLYYLRSVLNDGTPVVGMSGSPWFLDYNDFDAFLHKPCSIKEILTVLRPFL